MFFKKKTNTHNQTTETKEVLVSEYPKEVDIIHNEFYNAADMLLKEAQEIINKGQQQNVSKVNRLKSLGFRNVQEVAQLEPLLKRVEVSKEQIELVAYYKQKYPFNKFITEEQVKEICHKYNLVCGGVSRYKGFVPDKNLKEIENFQLKSLESTSITIEAFDGRESLGLFSANNVEIRRESNYWHIFEKGTNVRAFQQSKLSEFENGAFYGSDGNNLFGLSDRGHVNIVVKNKTLQICAPVKDMDITGLDLKDGYKLEIKYVPDPVVLQPVKGGYLILTAWGNEASDPLVINEMNN